MCDSQTDYRHVEYVFHKPITAMLNMCQSTWDRWEHKIYRNWRYANMLRV